MANDSDETVKGLQQFLWICGLWQGDFGGKTVFEEWKQVSANSLQGRGYFLKDGDTVITEKLRIEAKGGSVQYISDVSHNEGPVAFTLISAEEGRYVFENKEHDFPQRIIYVQRGSAHIDARIEGTDRQGKFRAIDYSFKRLH